jgi:hypothetical protein
MPVCGIVQFAVSPSRRLAVSRSRGLAVSPLRALHARALDLSGVRSTQKGDRLAAPSAIDPPFGEQIIGRAATNAPPADRPTQA